VVTGERVVKARAAGACGEVADAGAVGTGHPATQLAGWRRQVARLGEDASASDLDGFVVLDVGREEPRPELLRQGPSRV
jgi:hypothetical protein